MDEEHSECAVIECDPSEGIDRETVISAGTRILVIGVALAAVGALIMAFFGLKVLGVIKIRKK